MMGFIDCVYFLNTIDGRLSFWGSTVDKGTREFGTLSSRPSSSPQTHTGLAASWAVERLFLRGHDRGSEQLGIRWLGEQMRYGGLFDEFFMIL